ncbi:MAG: putative UDP-sugar epimerase [Bacillales bacterium]|nr:putative UDP-sugar epimerase [Bacillales bacterium]
MKNILITGVNSYVGKSMQTWLEKYPEEYSVTLISLRDKSWENMELSSFDVVLHVAGIAHVSTDPNLEELYYKVNRDLTIEVAKKAKNEGVKQFIFMSSIIVYGDSNDEVKLIVKDTKPNPSNFYGKSKLQAEEGIRPLQNENFKIAVVRPPMIYGKGSKGNYPKLAKLAKILPFFPDINNKRSMLHIDNLCEFLRLIIESKESGLFFPQNKEYVKTSEMVRIIAETHGKKIVLTKIFNPLIKVLGMRLSIINKVFGNLVYDSSMSNYKETYQIRNLRQTIEKTEK